MSGPKGKSASPAWGRCSPMEDDLKAFWLGVLRKNNRHPLSPVSQDKRLVTALVHPAYLWDRMCGSR